MKRLRIASCVLVTLILYPRSFDVEHPRPRAERRYSLPNPKRENPSTIPTVRSVLEKNTWYETRWKPQSDKLPESGRDEMLFMLAARWADDIRTRDKDQSLLPWHYVDYV
jgi:hypothetical protein